MHGAPGITDANSFRAIIFFSAWPTGSVAVGAYDADTQYTGSVLSGHFVDLLWCQPNIGYNERLFLLHILERYVTESPVPNVAMHFPEGDLSDFIRAVELSQFPSDIPKDAFLRRTARNKKFCRRQEQYVEDERLDAEIDLDSLERLSVLDLVTKWRGQEYSLEVYRRADGSVLLHYPGCKDEETGLECFEGADDGERFTLTMNDGDRRLFDGTNGVLLDAWQRPVRCFRRRKPKPTSPTVTPSPSPVRMSSRKQAISKRRFDSDTAQAAAASPPTPTAIAPVEAPRTRTRSRNKMDNSPGGTKEEKLSEAMPVEESEEKRPATKPTANPSVKTTTKPAATSVQEGTSPKPPKKRRLQRRAASSSQCGTCDACMIEDCGLCVYCKDLKRFGVLSKLKRRCKHRPICQVKG